MDGIVGLSNGKVTIKQCNNRGKISSSYRWSGGIIGASYSTNVDNCSNYNDVSSIAYAGGIYGLSLTNNTTDVVTITNCTNNGSISTSSVVEHNFKSNGTDSNYNTSSTGGICGAAIRTYISNCCNNNLIYSSVGQVGVAGIVGDLRNGTISKCYNTGDIGTDSYKNNFYAGIVAVSVYNSYIDSCYNTGTIKGNKMAAGICSYATDTSVKRCYNTGSISGGNYAGGIVGSFCPFENSSYGNNYIYYCYNTGTVTGTNYGSIVGYVNYVDIDYTYSLDGKRWGSVIKFKNATNQTTTDLCGYVIANFKDDNGNAIFEADGTGSSQKNGGYPVFKSSYWNN